VSIFRESARLLHKVSVFPVTRGRDQKGIRPLETSKQEKAALELLYGHVSGNIRHH